MNRRKWIKISVAVLACVVAFLLVWSLTDRATAYADGQTAEISFVDSLRLRRLLSIRKTEVSLRCGFSEELSVEMGGLTYYLAQDDCESVYVKELRLYYSISAKNHKKLHELISAYMM